MKLAMNCIGNRNFPEQRRQGCIYLCILRYIVRRICNWIVYSRLGSLCDTRVYSGLNVLGYVIGRVHVIDHFILTDVVAAPMSASLYLNEKGPLE